MAVATLEKTAEQRALHNYLLKNVSQRHQLRAQTALEICRVSQVKETFLALREKIQHVPCFLLAEKIYGHRSAALLGPLVPLAISFHTTGGIFCTTTLRREERVAATGVGNLWLWWSRPVHLYDRAFV